jgi:membrane protease YdiL (CAAX protease family)
VVSIAAYLIFGVMRYFLIDPVEFSVFWLVVYFFTNAFYEELLYRGIFLSSLEDHITENRLLLIQTLVFTAIHIPANLGVYFTDGDLIAMILAFTFQFLHGMIYGFVYLRTRSLWISVVLHYLTNWMGAWLFLIF